MKEKFLVAIQSSTFQAKLSCRDYLHVFCHALFPIIFDASKARRSYQRSSHEFSISHSIHLRNLIIF